MCKISNRNCRSIINLNNQIAHTENKITQAKVFKNTIIKSPFSSKDIVQKKL